MKESDVILTPVPQANGAIKIRPAVILRKLPLYHDFLVCGISSKLHQQVKDFDDIIACSDADFSSSGLKSTSLIRLGFLAVLPSHTIIGTIGSVSSERHGKLLKALSNYLLMAESISVKK